jgi:uncharacterized phage-associated protein
MLSCHDVAKYLLAKADPEVGDLMSNLKLQKLVYYAQGFHLALFDTPLFDEDIEAWAHGPVVPDLYHGFKQYGAGAIQPPTDLDLSLFSDETVELLDEVYSVFGQFSAWKLRNMTHEEPPWSEAGNSAVIPLDAMRTYFKTQID